MLSKRIKALLPDIELILLHGMGQGTRCSLILHSVKCDGPQLPWSAGLGGMKYPQK